MRPVPAGFCYNSGTNEHFLSVDELREMVAEQTGPAPFTGPDLGTDSRHPQFTELKTVA